MRVPTVLHFLGYREDRGGVLTAIRLCATQRQAHHVLVVDESFQQRRRPDLPVVRTPAVPPEVIGLRSLWPTFRAAWRLLPYTRAGSALVHGQSRSGTLVGVWLWLLGQNAVVISPHCYGRHRWFYRWAAACLGESWVWLSPAMKRHYDTATGGWAACIPEPTPTARARAARPRSDVITLAGAGTLVPWKGWHLVLEALARLDAGERAQFRFVHIGDVDETEVSAAYRANLRHQTSGLGLDDRVEWRGWQSESSALLDEADVMILPSWNEPMSLAGLEALAAGVPLVIADSGGLSDVITPGVNALVFRTGDVESLTACLRVLQRSDFLTQARARPPGAGPASVETVARLWSARYAQALGEEREHVI